MNDVDVCLTSLNLIKELVFGSYIANVFGGIAIVIIKMVVGCIKRLHDGFSHVEPKLKGKLVGVWLNACQPFKGRWGWLAKVLGLAGGGRGVSGERGLFFCEKSLLLVWSRNDSAAGIPFYLESLRRVFPR